MTPHQRLWAAALEQHIRAAAGTTPGADKPGSKLAARDGARSYLCSKAAVAHAACAGIEPDVWADFIDKFSLDWTLDKARVAA